MTDLTGNWNYPTQLQVGAGRIRELPAGAAALGIKAPLLVTDPGLAALPMIGEALDNCAAARLRVAMFSGIKSNPTRDNIEAGLAVYLEGGHDGVIAFGGGSALDAGKAIALMAGQDRPLFDFVDEGDNWRRVNEAGIAPILAVPTTAGTGSEVGRAAVVTDERAQLKRIIFHPRMLPQRVILDPDLTVGLPRHITAATGMDALTHNLEALCSPVYHPMAEGIALEGIRLVRDHLPRACEAGDDIDARTQMLVASLMGATAFQRGLGGTHALAHPLGAIHDKHHGLLNAILLPYVLLANRVAITETLERCARYLGLDDPGFDSFLAFILSLRDEVGIPHALSAIDIADDEAERIGAMAVADPTAATNPLPLTAADYAAIFRRACAGELAAS
jgi:alcohol dehydrogenase class IV